MECLGLLFLGLILALGSAQNEDQQMGWWKHAVIYQIYPKSFQSTTGNGTGDIKGILQRFDHIKSLGVDAIWVNPIYPSKTNADAGYDISDFKGVDPNFGTIQDLKDLIEKCHNNSIKIILDFVPNHSSSGHDWFQWSLANNSEYRDYYIWKDPGPTKLQSGEPQPPNNWLSNMNGPAWTYNENRKQFYLHQFLKEQPDLNYNNPKIRQEMKDVLKFWLDLNVDGFRMDAVYTIWEDLSYRDEPPLPGKTITDYNSMDHIYTAEQPQTFDILAEFRQVLDSYTNSKKGFQRIMFTESYTNKTSMLKKYYGTDKKPISHFPFNFLLLKNMNVQHVGEDWAKMISTWFDAIPLNQYWPNWVMGNHDNNRMSSRFTPEHTDIIHMSLMSLPGTYIVYYGDELALQDSYVRRDEGIDPQGTDAPEGQFLKKTRDPARGPMPWDYSENGGFSLEKPWLPLTSDRTVNVQAQTEAEKSHLKLFKKLVQMRKLNTYKNGDFMHGICNSTTPEVLIITRSLIDHPTIVTLANFASYRVAVDLQKFRPSLPDKMIVFASSTNSPFNQREVLNIKPIVMEPISGLVLSTATLD